jgi:NADH:ubiquinone oxidoreductase subunit 2 (subunit N)
MFIYNTSLVTLFWVLFSTVLTQFRTLHSFSNFSFSSFSLTSITILLFSMAGVPPFVGFFSKLFVLTLLTNNSFFLLYALFFVVLFLGLYFYVQNIRFLHSTNPGDTPSHYISGTERLLPVFYYAALTVLVTIVLGTVYVDDLLLFFT